MIINAPKIQINNHHDAIFNSHLASLVKHYNEQETLKVSPLENIILSNWINTQRSKKKRKLLNKQREEALNKIGFDWSPQVITWDLHFKMLVKAKEKHGTTSIPVRFSENPGLGDWVRCQRIYYNAGKLSAKHISKLNSIGFWWSVPEFLQHSTIEERARFELSQKIAA